MAKPFTSQVKCPHPECSHVGTMITKVHCRQHHNMEREDLFKEYGQPIPLRTDKRKVAAYNKWRREENKNFKLGNTVPTVEAEARREKRESQKRGGK